MIKLLSSALGLSLASAALAQSWIQRAHNLDESPSRWAAYDKARNRVVLHQNHALWEWVEDEFILRAVTDLGPYTRMAYDESRRTMVLFDGTATQSTWEWNGVALTPRATAQAPGYRYDSAIAFDPVRRRTVLFGGRLASGTTAETWEFDGTTWQRATPAQSPQPTSTCALTYDSARAQMVLVTAPGGSFYETWTYDGTTWTRRGTALFLGAYPRLAYDERRQRVVLPMGATWEWDGSTWTSGVPAIGYAVAFTYDAARQRSLLFSGARWVDAYDGTNWTRLATRALASNRLFFDEQLQRAVGGFGTRQWDGLTWREYTPATLPPARVVGQIAYDTHRRRGVMYGGLVSNDTILQDVWEWNGSTWVSVGDGPGNRWDNGIAYDSVRRRVVVFGGQTTGLGLLGDTWEYDGTTWQQMFPPTSPGARRGHRLVFDEARNVMVMFGGATDDTWTWNGQTWTRLTPNVAPSPRYAPAMVFDRARQRVLLLGGYAVATTDAWEWDGSTWTSVAGLNVWDRVEAAYDSAHGYVIATSNSDGERTFVRTPAVAAALPIGAACGSGGGPQLGAIGSPIPGRQRFGFDLVRAGATLPSVLLVSLASANLDLGGGCRLYVDPAQVVLSQVTLASASGTATWTLPIPARPELRGAVLHTQAGVLSPTGAALGTDFTAGVRAVIGD